MLQRTPALILSFRNAVLMDSITLAGMMNLTVNTQDEHFDSDLWSIAKMLPVIYFPLDLIQKWF